MMPRLRDVKNTYHCPFARCSQGPLPSCLQQAPVLYYFYFQKDEGKRQSMAKSSTSVTSLTSSLKKSLKGSYSAESLISTAGMTLPLDRAMQQQQQQPSYHHGYTGRAF